MFNRRTVAAIALVQLLALGVAGAETLKENWSDFLHYTKIGRFDLATGYGEAILQSSPEPTELLKLARENHYGYQIIKRVVEDPPNAELAAVAEKIIKIVEEGRFSRRTDDALIATEVRRLSSTERGKYIATQRLKDAGEYAIPFMLDAMADPSRRDELPHIIETLPKIGRDAIRPLVAALQMKDVAIKTEIINALGEIGYNQSLGYLKYVVENSDSTPIRAAATVAVRKIDPAAMKAPAALLFYKTAEEYYYHADSLAPAEDADFGNIWFWDEQNQQLTREPVDRDYFYELMAMRNTEWSLRADESFGAAIGLWLASFLKAEAADVESMPDYFGASHADALVYATTAGPAYLHQALARAVKDKNADVALGAVEALATTAGEKSLLYRMGVAQPLVEALSFDDKAVKYSAAIAVAEAGPTRDFPEAKLVTANLGAAIGERGENVSETTRRWGPQIADEYALRAAEAMLSLARTRNKVINLSLARAELVAATSDPRSQMQILAGKILAHLDSPEAQRAVAAMALNSDNDQAVRIAAFDSLGLSAKINANMLPEDMIDAIYSLIGSDATDPELRSAAAAAYGALNLPSRKVKDLILDQAKS